MPADRSPAEERASGSRDESAGESAAERARNTQGEQSTSNPPTNASDASVTLPTLPILDEQPVRGRRSRGRDSKWGRRRAAVGHFARLTLVALTVVGVHRATQPKAVVTSDPTAEATRATLAAHFADADQLRPTPIGLLMESQRQEWILAPSWPAGDRFTGFVGPTRVVLKLHPPGEAGDAGHIAAIRVVDSADTAEHVAQVRADEHFLPRYDGLSLEQVIARPFDAVSGATLTSWATDSAIKATAAQVAMTLDAAPNTGAAADSQDAREQNGLPSIDEMPQPSKFGHRPQLAHVQQLVPGAEAIDAEGIGSDRTYSVSPPMGEQTVLQRTADAGIEVLGYQGPSDVLLIVKDSQLVAAQLGESFDNDDYTAAVRDDWQRMAPFRGQTLDAVASLELDTLPYEGTSGATLTSLAAAETIVLWAREATEKSAVSPADESPPCREEDAISSGEATGTQHKTTAEVPLVQRPTSWTMPLLLAFAIVGGAFGLSRFRGRLRTLWRLITLSVAIATGGILSQALLWGWIVHGRLPGNGYGLLALAAVAILAPSFVGRNVYCSHLCGHGATQQLLLPLTRPAKRRSRVVAAALAVLPATLVGVAAVITLAGRAFPLTRLEVFDAYAFPLCAPTSAVLFAISLAWSSRRSMAYCRHGCPTGAVLGYLRWNRRSGTITSADLFVAAIAGIAWASV